MAESNSLEPAIRRLSAALDLLEGAVERRAEQDRRGERLAAQVHALSADRSRLAAGLDQEAARSRGLESTHAEAVQRIDAIIATIESVLAKAEG